MTPWIRRAVPRIAIGLVLVLWIPLPGGGQEYTIGPGDVLGITVWGHPDLSSDYIVDPDGYAPFPLIGRVKAGGATARQVAASLTEALGKDYLVNPQVIVAVKAYLSQKVTILGEAAKPGVFYLTGPTTLVDLLSKAGWLAKGAGKEILVVRDQPGGQSPSAGEGTTIQRLNIDKIQAGSAAENVRLQAGDTVFVASKDENTTRFFVFGEVKKPGAYPLEHDTNVLEGITIAGGFTDKASPGRTRVIRVGATGQQVLEIDMNEIVKRGRRDKAVRLQAGDVVVVPESFF
jgi:polysaccharide export outer membrane protein